MTTTQRILDANPELRNRPCTCKLMHDENGCLVGEHIGDIELHHILKAIGNMLVVVDAWGNFYRLKMSLADKLPRFDKEAGTVRWNLLLNWHNQEQPVKDFVGSLLDN